MQPDGRRSRTAIEGERERTLRGLLTVERVGHVKHFRFNLAVAALDGEASGAGTVLQQFSVDRGLVMGHNRRGLGHVVMLFFFLFFVSRSLPDRRSLLGGRLGLNGALRGLFGGLRCGLFLGGGFGGLFLLCESSGRNRSNKL